MGRIVTLICILIGIPVGLYGMSQWMDFWIRRSIGEWMAMGCGVPVAIGIAIIVWKSTDMDVKARLPPIGRGEARRRIQQRKQLGASRSARKVTQEVCEVGL